VCVAGSQVSDRRAGLCVANSKVSDRQLVCVCVAITSTTRGKDALKTAIRVSKLTSGWVPCVAVNLTCPNDTISL